jgi:hypothetical protein
MFLRALVFAAIFIFGADAAWSQNGPNRTLQEELTRLYCGPNPPPQVIAEPEVYAEICESPGVCARTCAKWASWQTDFLFSFEACTAKCRNRDLP